MNVIRFFWVINALESNSQLSSYSLLKLLENNISHTPFYWDFDPLNSFQNHLWSSVENNLRLLYSTAPDSSIFFPQTNPKGLTTTQRVTTIIRLLCIFCITYFANYSDQNLKVNNFIEERLVWVDGWRDTIDHGKEGTVASIFGTMGTCCCF